ncbi:LuxR C-terminal-related transcriptional regulator [Bacteroidota bacterium]
MNESLQIILLTGSLITGIIAIMLSNQLARKYNLPWLSSYFYYLIFLFVFGIYGIVGSRLMKVFMQNQGMDPGAIDSITQFITFLGIPFLVLSWYMFIRLSHEIVKRKVLALFNLVFFGIILIVFIAIGILLAKRDMLGDNRYEIIRGMMLIGFTTLSLLVYAYSLIQLFINSGKFLDHKDRSNIRLFGLFYLIFTVGTVGLLNLSHLGIIFSIAFIILLFAIHLLPIFFLSMYLDKNFIEPAARQKFDDSLAAFVSKFEISKRETEVVELICKGQSNQDISDSLFISLQTVKDHIHRIYLKTGVKNRVQLTNLIRKFT